MDGVWGTNDIGSSNVGRCEGLYWTAWDYGTRGVPVFPLGLWDHQYSHSPVMIPLSGHIPLARNNVQEGLWMEQSVALMPEQATVVEGIVTGLSRMPRSASSRVTLNRRWMVIVPSGLSDLFAGMRVRVHGVWHQGARRRYLLASLIEPLEALPSLSIERLSRALLGTPTPSEEQRRVLELLSPAVNWLLTAGQKAVAKKLAALKLRKAEQIAGNPFSLVKRGLVKFDAAEMLHRQLQTDPWHLGRLQAGTTEVLRRAEKSGRARVTRQELIERVTTVLALSSDFEVDWTAVWRSSLVARDGEYYCLPSWYHQRRQALQILRLNQLMMTLSVPSGYEEILRHRFSVVTGAAMSGKTTLVRGLAASCRAAGWRVAVTAMTGKAASVLGEDAQTVHRLIGYGPLGCRKEPLELDLLIIDEISMMVWPLLLSVLRVMRGQIVFVGDPRQLPPVEGEPVHRELLGLLPVLDLGIRPPAQVEVVRHWSEAHLLSNLEHLVRRCHAEGGEWQVLSPVKRSQLGTQALNLFLQGVINPDGIPIGGGYRVGDRVIVIRNDYDGSRPVYNGQVGRVQGGGENTVAVELAGGTRVHVSTKDLELAYCLTVHKSQGSRYDTVVFVIPPVAADFARDEHMQYVGLTRGRQKTVCYAL